MIRQVRALIALATLLFVSAQANATIVRFETAVGRFDVNLYDRRTPATATPSTTDGGGGGGAAGTMSLLLLGALGVWRRRRNDHRV